MSNIPASERKPTKIDFFDKAIDVRFKIVKYIDCDFNPSKRYDENGVEYSHYWIISNIRDAIYNAAQDMILSLTHANTIYITNMYEYNERRRYMTKAIGDCEYIIQEIQFAIRSFGIKPNKYALLIEDIDKLITSIKNWRKADNVVKRRLQG